MSYVWRRAVDWGWADRSVLSSGATDAGAELAAVV